MKHLDIAKIISFLFCFSLILAYCYVTGAFD